MNRTLGRIVRFAAVGGIALSLAFATTTQAATTAPAKAATPQPPFTPNFFGMSVGADLTTLGEAQFDNEMNRMKSIGVHWVRAVIPWALVQHNDSNPADDDWLLIDRLVNTVQAEGMQLVGIIDNPPLWAESNIAPVSNCTDQPPFDLPSYANFAAAVAARYGASRIAAIELENAPNLPGVWPKAEACPYTRLMQLSYPAIKAADPNILVLTAGLGAQKNDGVGVPGDVFFAQLYTYGVKGSFDVLSWHPYSYPCFPSGSCTKSRPWYRTANVIQTMADNGDSKPIWATEFGAPTNGTATDGHVDENNQAAMMVDGMKDWVKLSNGGPFFVFEYRDFGHNPTVKSDWFGLVNYKGKQRKLSFYTYQYEATGKTTVTIPANVLAGVPHA